MVVEECHCRRPTFQHAIQATQYARSQYIQETHPGPPPTVQSSNLASKHRRPRHSVCLRLIRIIRYTRIAPLVRTRERNEPRRSLAAAARDLELMAPRVELGARVRVGGVQRDDLVAHEIIATGDALGDRVGHDATGFHQRCGAPGVGCAGAAGLLDFEPDGAGGGGVSIGRFSQVRRERTYCSACRCCTQSRGILPCKSRWDRRGSRARGSSTGLLQIRQRPRRGAQQAWSLNWLASVRSICSLSRTNDASLGVAAALEIGRIYVLDGTVALNLA